MQVHVLEIPYESQQNIFFLVIIVSYYSLSFLEVLIFLIRLLQSQQHNWTLQNQQERDRFWFRGAILHPRNVTGLSSPL